MPENLIQAFQMIGNDFYNRLRPFNPESLVRYMLRRAHEFLIPGSY